MQANRGASWALLGLLVVGLAGCDSSTVMCGDLICPAASVCVASGCATPEAAAQCAERSEGADCELGTGHGLCFGGACRLAECGDGEFGFGEACDDGPANSDTPNASCRTNCAAARCGDGIRDSAPAGRAAETCDDGNTTDGDGCQHDCQVATCGDGIVDRPGEACDEGAANSDAPDALCRPTCTLRHCGDGVKDGLEACDDGNNVDGDHCSANCLSDLTCGNRLIDPGEQCDVGVPDDGDDDGCQANCQARFCGDGIIDPVEGCDLGTANSNAANAQCRLDCRPLRCGDGVVDTNEICDDGNNTSGDGCAGDCKSNETCGNGVIDLAKGEQCDDGNQVNLDSCHNNCKVPRCGDGVRDTINGEGCDLGGLNSDASDAACRTTCQVPRCGDGVRNRGVEVCDDGNFINGDGCSGDCLSQETCGNGYVDFARGEQCDSGIAGLGGDGCSSTCKLEQLSWSVNEPASISPRRYAAAAYDPVRRTALLFGGADNNQVALGDTWLFQDGYWRELYLPTAPAARYGHAMAFDPLGDQILLFGGHVGGGVDGETWAYKDGAWQLLTPLTQPPSRHFSAMVSAFGEVLMHGGSQADIVLADLWEWNGSDWQQTVVANALPRAGHALVAEANVLRVLGGTENPIALPNDVPPAAACGVLSPAWESVPCPGVPNVFGAAAMLSNSSVWVGGWAGQPLMDSVEFNGDDVTLTAFPVSGPVGGTLVNTDENTVMFLPGGTFLGDFETTGEPPLTFRAGDVEWRRLTPETPVARQGAASAYNAHLGSTLLVGGNNDGGILGDAWLQRRGEWRTVSAPMVARTDAAMAYDEVRRVWVLFGGINGSTVLSDTWEFDGTSWSQSVGVEPTGRFAHRMVYDTANARVVLVGGQTSKNPDIYSAETWTYQNRQWSRLLNAGGAAIGYSGLAYDRARNRIVRFGGVGAGGTMNGQTAELINNVWQVRTTAIAPRRRRSLMMSYDPVAKETVLFGGRVDGSLDQETWIWNGTRWAQTSPAGAFEATEGAGLIYDAQQHALLMLGGKTELAYSSNATLLRLASGSPETCDFVADDLDGDGLAGCADPDCWGRCTPLCPPGTSCGAVEQCGDGVCNLALEGEGWCTQDCP